MHGVRAGEVGILRANDKFVDEIGTRRKRRFFVDSCDQVQFDGCL